jgi:hypothetical protein
MNMDDGPPNQTSRNQQDCRRCGKPIFWHKSRGGKNYPCDSPTDRRAFHRCEAAPTQQATNNAQPAQTPKPITPDYFEATLEQRIDALEKQVAQLARTIGEADIPW